MNSDQENALLEATAFAHSSVSSMGNPVPDSWSDFLEFDQDGAYGLVYHKDKFYDATLRIELTPYADDDKL